MASSVLRHLAGIGVSPLVPRPCCTTPSALLTFHVLHHHAEVSLRLEGAEHADHEGVLGEGEDVPLHKDLLDLVAQDEVLLVDLLQGETLPRLPVPHQVHGPRRERATRPQNTFSNLRHRSHGTRGLDRQDEQQLRSETCKFSARGLGGVCRWKQGLETTSTLPGGLFAARQGRMLQACHQRLPSPPSSPVGPVADQLDGLEVTLAGFPPRSRD